MKKVSADLIALVDEVPALDLPFAKIISPLPGKPVKAIVVNSRPVGVYTHFVNGRTIPHLRDRTLCEGCQLARKKAYKCYFGVWVLPDQAYGLAELTHYAAHGWHKKISDPGFDFRGAEIRVYRLGKSANGRCRAEFDFRQYEPAKLVTSIPILEILRVIWGGESKTKRLMDGLQPSTLDDVPL